MRVSLVLPKSPAKLLRESFLGPVHQNKVPQGTARRMGNAGPGSAGLFFLV